MSERTILARKSAGFKNQTEISKLMGISRDAYAKYEIDRKIPTEHLSKFVEITGVSYKWLVANEGEMLDTSHNDDPIFHLEALKKLAKDDDIIKMNIEMLTKLILEKEK